MKKQEINIENEPFKLVLISSSPKSQRYKNISFSLNKIKEDHLGNMDVLYWNPKVPDSLKDGSKVNVRKTITLLKQEFKSFLDQNKINPKQDKILFYIVPPFVSETLDVVLDSFYVCMDIWDKKFLEDASCIYGLFTCDILTSPSSEIINILDDTMQRQVLFIPGPTYENKAFNKDVAKSDVLLKCEKHFELNKGETGSKKIGWIGSLEEFVRIRPLLKDFDFIGILYDEEAVEEDFSKRVKKLKATPIKKISDSIRHEKKFDVLFVPEIFQSREKETRHLKYIFTLAGKAVCTDYKVLKLINTWDKEEYEEFLFESREKVLVPENTQDLFLYNKDQTKKLGVKRESFGIMVESLYTGLFLGFREALEEDENFIVSKI